MNMILNIRLNDFRIIIYIWNRIFNIFSLLLEKAEHVIYIVVSFCWILGLWIGGAEYTNWRFDIVLLI